MDGDVRRCGLRPVDRHGSARSCGDPPFWVLCDGVDDTCTKNAIGSNKQDLAFRDGCFRSSGHDNFRIKEAFVQAFIPASTVRFAPVMYEDSGLATNATIAAISSTCPYRSSAVAAFCGTDQSPAPGFKSVSIGPGWTLLTVMPRLPTSLDNAWVNIFTAPLLAAEGTSPATPARPPPTEAIM